MKVIVLAAGYGTRLYPLTKDTPKPLVKVAGVPILEHILNQIYRLPGVSEIIVVSNNRFFPNFEEWLLSFDSKVPIKLLNDGSNSNDDRLGALGDIEFAVKKIGINEEVLVIAGDNLFEFSLSNLHLFFRQKKSSVVALYDLKDKSLLAGKFGVAQIDENSRIVGFEEKPQSPKSTLASTACYFFTKEDLASLSVCMSEQKKPDNLGDFVRWLSLRKNVYGFAFSEKWFDIGSHEQLKDAEHHFGSR